MTGIIQANSPLFYRMGNYDYIVIQQ